MSNVLTFRHWISADIKFSLPISGRLYPSHYSLLYFCKGKRPAIFHPDRLPIVWCRHCGGELRDYGLQGFELKDPGTVFELVAVMKLREIEGSIEPHFVDDFKPAVAESAQRVGVAPVLLGMVLVVTLSPGTTREALLGEKMGGVPDVFVTSPARKKQ